MKTEFTKKEVEVLERFRKAFEGNRSLLKGYAKFLSKECDGLSCMRCSARVPGEFCDSIYSYIQYIKNGRILRRRKKDDRKRNSAKKD